MHTAPSAIDRKHFKLLLTVGRLVVASPEMVNRVNYSKGSLTTTYETLRTLCKAHYLKAIYWRVEDFGNPRVLYCLDTLGYKVLVNHGVDRSELIHPSKNRIKVGPVAHLMEANELIVKALELVKTDPSLKIRTIPEPLLRRHPLEKSGYILIPDAWVQIKRGTGEAAFVFELDKSSIPLERIEPRIRGYMIADQSSEYFDLFGTMSQVVVWVVADNDRDRLQSLRRVTKGILGPNHPQADLFLFGLSSSSYFDKAWYFADSDIPRSLLPQSWEVNGQT